jgi:Tol biopolymer transport system component
MPGSRNINGSTFFVLAVLCFTITAGAQEYPVNNYETIRNGAFVYGNSAWFTMGNYTGLYPAAAADGDGSGLSLVTTTAEDSMTYALQQIYLPTRINSARLQLAFRFEAKQGAQLGGFQIAIASTVNNQIQPVIVLEQRNNSSFGGYNWQKIDKQLSASQLQQLQQLRTKGMPVYLQLQLNSYWVTAHLDAISLKVDGVMQFPQTKGRIAFVMNSLKEGMDHFQLYTIDPTGANPKIEYESNGTVYGLTWMPDGSGLAFSSSQDMVFSPFSGDIFELRNGSVRKITTPTNHATLVKNGGPKGTVTGKVINGTGRSLMVAVTIEGASEPHFISLAPYPRPGHEAEYEISGVIDAGQRTQLVHGREGSYVWLAPAGVDVKPGGKARAADLHITSARASYTATSLSYGNKGQYIYFAFPNIMRIGSGGGIPENMPGWRSLIMSSGLAHSPIKDQLVYIASAGSSSMYLTQVGGNPQQIINQNNVSWMSSPHWTADGQGFVYTQTGVQNPTGSTDVHYYNLANKQSVPLTMLFNENADNPSPSPDGRFVVFERTMSNNSSGDVRSIKQLWVMQADNPAVMWPLVTQGSPALPRWK